MEDNRCNHISTKGETRGMKTCRYAVFNDGLCEGHYNMKIKHEKRDKEIPKVDVMTKVECFSKETVDKLFKSTYFVSEDIEEQKKLSSQKLNLVRYIKKATLQGDVYMVKVNYDRRPYGRFNNRVGRNDAFVLRWSGTSMPSKIRNVLFYDRYFDLDFVNCHPTITNSIFAKYNLERTYTSEMASNEGRALFLSSLMERTGFDRKKCKTLPLSIFYGGKYTHWIERHCHPDMLMQEDLAHLYNLQREVDINIRTLLEGPYKYILDFAKRVKATYLDIKEEYRDIYSIAWAYLCQDIERRAIEHLIYAVEKEGIEIGSVIHDGFHLEKKYSVEHMKETFFEEWKRVVREGLKCDMELDIELDIDIKPMEPMNLEEYKTEEEVRECNTYDGVKTLYEKSNFFLSVEGKYCSILQGGNYVIQNKATFKDRFENMKYEEKLYNDKKDKWEVKSMAFIDRWFKDENKLTYTQARVYPPPMECPEGEYNLWTGFDAELTTYPQGKSMDDYKEEIEYIIKHLEYIGGSGYDYLIKTQALYAQQPGKKNGIMTTYKSDVEGIGKSTICNLNRAWMGERWTCKIENPDAVLLGSFNSVIENKVYVFLEEFDGSDTRSKQGSILMELITSVTDLINKKGVSAYNVKSFTHYEGSTNTLLPKKITSSNRRDVFYDIKGNPKPKQYFDKLYDVIGNKYAMKAWYEYLLTIDINKVDWIKDRPENEMFDDLKEASRDILEDWVLTYLDNIIFLKKECETKEEYDVKIMVEDMYDEFIRYITDHKIEYKTHLRNFGIKLKKYKLDCWISYKPKHKSGYKFNLIDCLQELYDKKIYTAEDIETYSDTIKAFFTL